MMLFQELQHFGAGNWFSRKKITSKIEFRGKNTYMGSIMIVRVRK